MADLRVIAKSNRGQQEIACDLYESVIMDAKYLAGTVADGEDRKEVQNFALLIGAEVVQAGVSEL